MPGKAPSRRLDRLAPWIAAAAAFLAFLPAALRNGFAYDDFRFILRNPHVAPAGGVGEFLGRIPSYLTDPRTVDPLSPTGIVRPLRTLEFALDRSLFGLDSTWFHIHSALWHALAAALAYLILRRLLDDVRPALFGALVFALHPVQVESVAWVTSRGDVAMGACALASTLLALRSRGFDRALVGSLVLGLAAMSYKETAVILPLLVFGARLVETPRVGRTLLSSWPWWVLSAAYLGFRAAVMVGGYAHVTTHVLGGSTAGTFATMFRGFGYYLALVLVPARQAIDWYMPVSTSLADPAALGWLAVHATLVGSAVAVVRRHPRWSAAVCLFYFPLIPVANWPFALGIPTSERFLYLPMLGAALALGLLAKTVLARSPRACIAGGVALVCLGVLSVQNAFVWENDQTLWRNAAAHHSTPRGAGMLGAELRRDGLAARRRGDGEEAERLFRLALDRCHEAIDLWHRIESVSFSTSYPVLEPESNAANLCLLLREYEHGVFHARRAVDIGGAGMTAEGDEGKVPPQPYYNLGLLLARVDRPAAALRAMEQAAAHGMPFAAQELHGLLLRLETALRERGFMERARRAAEWAVEVDPKSKPARARLRLHETESLDDLTGLERAIALAERGRLVAADAAFAEARPDGSATQDWVRARLEARGTPAGWRAARDAYDLLDTPTALYRQGVCEENLGNDAGSIASYREALAAPGDAPWRGDAERALGRIARGCPVRHDHGLVPE